MKTAQAFTIKELLALGVCLSILVILFGASQPVLRSGSKTAGCQNNLRIVSEALLADAAEHNSRFIWQEKRHFSYQRASPNVWENLILLSNHLASPRVFTCPADSRQPAQEFSSAAGGLAHSEHQNNSISYFISTDASLSVPNNVLIGDRSLSGGVATQCSLMAPFTGAFSFDRQFGQANRIHWKSILHGPDLAIITTIDGATQPLDVPALNRTFVNFEGDGNYNNHVLFPF